MLGPIGKSFSKLLAQTTRKSNRQVDMESRAEVGGGVQVIFVLGLNMADLPQAML